METAAIALLNLAVALLVIAVSLRIRAKVILSQSQAAVIQDPIKLGKKFCRIGCYLITAGFVCIVIWLLPLWFSKLPSGYWLSGGITLFAVAVNSIVQGKELTAKYQKEFGKKEYGQKLYRNSNYLIIAAGFLLIAGIILQVLGIILPVLATSG